MSQVFSVYTRVAANQTDSLIESGQSITVGTIVFNNTNASAETSTLEEANSTTVIQTVTVPGNSTVEIQYSEGQLFHRGMQVTTGATTACTVYHTHGGS